MSNKWINSVDDVIAALALAGLMSVTISSVIFRFVFNNPFPWAEEVALAFHTWVVFIGISSTMKRNGHIGIGYFVDRLPKRLKMVADLVRAAVLYFVLLYVFVYLGYEFTAQASTVTPVLKLNYQWIAIAVPIGGLLTAYHFTGTLVKSFRNELQ